MYEPNLTRYQQLKEPITGRFDCTAYSGAILVDAHSQGLKKVTGRQVRLASNEPVPVEKSPGLNLPQVDESVIRLTGIDLDTRTGMYRTDAQRMIAAGRWATVQVRRSILVNRGYSGGNSFGGGHALTAHYDGSLWLGDPLVPNYIRADWDALWDAAAALEVNRFGDTVGAGKANVQFTRDVTASWQVKFGLTLRRRSFWRYYVLDGHIVTRTEEGTHGWSAPCTPPRWYPGPFERSLVKVMGDGSRSGWYIDSRYAKEV